jgi:hypothetical protein
MRDAAMTPRTRRHSLIAAGMTVAISFVTFGVVTVLYVTHEVQESQKHQCGIISLSTQPRPTPPVPPFDPQTDPLTPFGRDIGKYIKDKQAYDKAIEQFNLRAAEELRNYSREIGCDKK